MNFFTFTPEEKIRLKRLNDDKALVFALKKLFLNASTGNSLSAEVQTLAAERIAIGFIQDAFRDLNAIKPDDPVSSNDENMV